MSPDDVRHCSRGAESWSTVARSVVEAAGVRVMGGGLSPCDIAGWSEEQSGIGTLVLGGTASRLVIAGACPIPLLQVTEPSSAMRTADRVKLPLCGEGDCSGGPAVVVALALEVSTCVLVPLVVMLVCPPSLALLSDLDVRK